MYDRPTDHKHRWEPCVSHPVLPGWDCAIDGCGWWMNGTGHVFPPDWSERTPSGCWCCHHREWEANEQESQ